MFININGASTPRRLKEKVVFADIIKKNIIKKSSCKSTSAKRFTIYNIFVMINNSNIFKKKNKDLLIIF